MYINRVNVLKVHKRHVLFSDHSSFILVWEIEPNLQIGGCLLLCSIKEKLICVVKVLN